MATATSTFTTPTVSSTDNLSPVSVSVTSHGWATGDIVGFQGLTEMTELNGQAFTITRVDANTFTLDGIDGTSFTDEATGGADTVFLVSDISGYLRTGKKFEDVTVALSGTYSSTVYLERALTRDALVWEKVLPLENDTWNTANATVSEIYQTTQDNEILRLRVAASAPTGTVDATLTDSDKVIQEFKDLDGNVLATLSQNGFSTGDFTGTHAHSGAETHSGVETHSGAETHSGVETHSGAETHTGAEEHTGAETHTGIETHTGAETHTGIETHTGAETHTGIETHAGADTFAAVMRQTSGDAVLFEQPAPGTMTDAATITDAQLLGGIIEGTPGTAQSYTTRTGTQIEASLAATVETDMCFDITIINLGGAGDIITLVAGDGVSIVGSVTIDDAGADITSSGTFRFRRSASNTFIAYRIS